MQQEEEEERECVRRGREEEEVFVLWESEECLERGKGRRVSR